MLAGFWLPVGSLAGLPFGLGGILAVFILSLPILFAGIVFATSLARVARPEAALGSNILGAVLGGLLESASFVTGIGSLLLISLFLYGAALTTDPGRRWLLQWNQSNEKETVR